MCYGMDGWGKRPEIWNIGGHSCWHGIYEEDNRNKDCHMGVLLANIPWRLFTET